MKKQNIYLILAIVFIIGFPAYQLLDGVANDKYENTSPAFGDNFLFREILGIKQSHTHSSWCSTTLTTPYWMRVLGLPDEVRTYKDGTRDDDQYMTVWSLRLITKLFIFGLGMFFFYKWKKYQDKLKKERID